MQTTLRIDDKLYREAKAEAAREGTTITRLLEEGIRLRLEKKAVAQSKPHHFRIYAGRKAVSHTSRGIQKIANDEQEAHDLSKLGIASKKSR